MPHELIYTSAPRGLKPGATGYCTVAHTPDLPKDLAEQLEGISHYRHLSVGADPARSGNPIAFAHSILTTGYTVHHVVSRIADSGLDHSGRSNFLAHHVVFDPDRVPDAGPAWLCEQRLFVQKWDRPASLIPDDRAIPSGQSEPRPCRKWEQLTGDAGWGGVLAAATNAAEPAYLIFEPGQDVLGLLVDSMALLPTEARWNVTFNTYFTGKAVRTTCQWRCVTSDSPEAKEALSMRRGVVLRLDREMSGSPSGPLVEAARTGQVDLPTPKRRPVPASVRTTRPVESDDLPEPEPEPVMPASRPIRTRPVEPVSEPDESNYDIPLPAAPRSSAGRGGLGPLLLGIVLGGLLVLAFTSLVELAAGKSIMGFLGVKSADYEQAKKEQERLEGELANKIVDLDKERKSADSAKSELRRQLQERERDLSNLQKDLDAARKELKDLKDKPVLPASNEGGFFLSTRDLVRDLLRQQDLKDALAKVDGLQKEIAGLKDRLAAAGNAPLALAIPVVKLDKIKLGGQPAVDLFKLKFGAEAKPKLEVFGLPPDLKATALGDGDRILLKSADTGFDATLAVGKDGQVRIEGSNMEKHPLLGFAVIRVNPGTGDPPAYRQLFWAESVPSDGLSADLAKGAPVDGRNRKYAFKYETRLSAKMKPEVDVLKAANQLAGRSARIGINARVFDLESGPQPFVLENRALDGDPAIKLQVTGGEVILDVTYPDVKDIPERIRIEALEIVRPIPEDKDRGFPGYNQELLRLFPR